MPSPPLADHAPVEAVAIRHALIGFYGANNADDDRVNPQHAHEDKTETEREHQYPADDTGQKQGDLKVDHFLALVFHEGHLVALDQPDHQRAEQKDRQKELRHHAEMT